jgi:hypothetical protein
MQTSTEHRRSALSLPRPFAPNEQAREIRGERRPANRAGPQAAHLTAQMKERFGPTYGCVEWFIYEEAVPVSQASCD